MEKLPDFSGDDFLYIDFDATRTVDFSVPSESYGDHVLYGGSYIVARVNGAKVVLTSRELQKLLDNGEDVLILGTVWEG